MKEKRKIVAGITLGDPNGIGPEIILKVFSDSRIMDFCTPVIYGSMQVLKHYKSILHLPDLALSELKDPSKPKKNKVNVIDCLKEETSIEVGQATSEGGKLAFESLKLCAEHAKEGIIDVVVTSPLNKKNIELFNEGFTGHTGYLAEMDKGEALMILCSEKMKIAMVTGHVSIGQVKEKITVESVIEKIEALNRSMKNDFGIAKPRIAVLGLNPHAGEEGMLGTEEKEIISPAIEQVKTKGIIAVGPYPSDGFFGSGNYTNFDAILAMYHDQALIPFKTLSFENGVNYTAGLSFVRTSPDHGTAYEIAGKGEAHESSLRSALYYAIDIFRKREEELALREAESV